MLKQQVKDINGQQEPEKETKNYNKNKLHARFYFCFKYNSNHYLILKKESFWLCVREIYNMNTYANLVPDRQTEIQMFLRLRFFYFS